MQNKLKQIWGFVARIALCCLLPFAAQATETITYFHNDIVGSPVVATDASGAVLWKETYEPFGERVKEQPGSEKNAVWFSGKPQDTETGFIYMGARYYDPTIGRFTGVDPAAVNASNVHSANRYAYANNNPYVNKDPDGRVVETVWDVANLAIGATSLTYNIKNGDYWGAALDAAGLIYDGTATAVPFLPAGASASIKASRATETVVNNKQVREGIYEFIDTTGKTYIGQSGDIAARLEQHIASGKLARENLPSVKTTEVLGGQTKREVAEHKRIQEITGGVPARYSDKVSNKKDPIGPKRQHLLNENPD